MQKALNYLKGALPDGQSSSTVTCPNAMMNGAPAMVSTGLLPGSNYGINCMDKFRENIELNVKNNVINDLKKIKAQMEK